jgi:hypothetical protein
LLKAQHHGLLVRFNRFGQSHNVLSQPGDLFFQLAAQLGPIGSVLILRHIAGLFGLLFGHTTGPLLSLCLIPASRVLLLAVGSNAYRAPPSSPVFSDAVAMRLAGFNYDEQAHNDISPIRFEPRMQYDKAVCKQSAAGTQPLTQAHTGHVQRVIPRRPEFDATALFH